MSRSRFLFSFSDLNLNVPQIERIMGYKEDESNETIAEMIATQLKEAESFIRVKAEYALIDGAKFNDPDKSVELNNLVFNIKKIVYSQIKRSDSVAVFMCTAGNEIGIKSSEAMKEGDLLTGYVYDVIGSEAVEAAADLMQSNLELEMASEGRKITNRYSPGYCGWNVEEQHKLFKLIPDNYCGIRLTPSALMDPVKSVSGFIGIGDHVRYNPYTCGMCDMKDCIYRSRKNSAQTKPRGGRGSNSQK